jgi:integrase
MAERLYLRNKIWWCWYYSPTGKRVVESTKCTSKEAARAVLRRKERQEQGVERPSYISVGDVLDKLEAWIKANRSPDNLTFVKSKCARLREGLGATTDAAGLSRAELDAYVSKRLDTKVGKRGKRNVGRYTVKREIKVLWQALRRAGVKLEADARPEIDAPYVPRKKWLTRDEFDELSCELEPDRWRWVCVAVYTGARKSEVEGLEWSDIRDGEVHIRGTKTKKSDRHVPYHPTLEATLGKRGKGTIVRPWGKVDRDLKAACRRAEVPEVSPNDLRRTYASWLLQAGVTSSVVAELLGHSTTELVDMTYGKLSKAALREAVARI